MQQYNKEDLKAYIAQCKMRLNKILHRLEWSEEGVLKEFNSNSKSSSVKEVIKKSCSPKVVTYPDSWKTKNSIVLETKRLQELLQCTELEAPRNFRELQANFTREQKLQIYEHVIGNTEKLENNIETQVAKGEISLADILAQKKRKEKRKKRRFRKSKPTHIEEVRSLVDLQMKALRQFVGNRINKKQKIAGKKGNDYNVRTEDNYERNRHKEERKPYDDYYKREQNKDRIKKERTCQDLTKIKDCRRSRSPRSRSKEFHYESKRHKGSRSKELSFDERRRSRSRSKGREQRRSRSKERRKRSRSRSKDISKRRKHSRSRSYERFSKYSNRKDYDSYYGKNDEKSRHNERYHRKHSKSPETSISKQHNHKETTKSLYYKDEYTTNHQSKSRDKDNYKHLLAEETSWYNSKHKKKNHKRDRS